MGILSGPILSRLGGVLRNTGGGLLRDVIVRNLPESGPVVDAIAARLGIPISADREQTAGEIVARHEAEAAAAPGVPTSVEQAAAAVEAERASEWARALSAVAAAAQERERTMQSESRSPYWLVRNWRPIYALETIGEMMLIVAVFLWLLIAGEIERANLALGLLTGAYAALRVGVLGVYVGGRSFEKGRRVAQ